MIEYWSEARILQAIADLEDREARIDAERNRVIRTIFAAEGARDASFDLEIIDAALHGLRDRIRRLHDHLEASFGPGRDRWRPEGDHVATAGDLAEMGEIG